MRKRAVICKTTNARFPSLARAAEAVGVSYQTLKEAIDNDWTCKGLMFDFDDGYDDHYCAGDVIASTIRKIAPDCGYKDFIIHFPQAPNGYYPVSLIKYKNGYPITRLRYINRFGRCSITGKNIVITG